MKVVVQRVSEASVAVEGRIVSSIKRGLLLLVGFTHSDSDQSLEWMARKVVNLRIFEDATGKMNLNLKKIEGELLAVSQFTLYADSQKGNRPSFIDAARAEPAETSFDIFCLLLEKEFGRTVQRGVFGARMEVSIINDGPVTIMLESPNPS